jgi:formylglycine-generating enzyme required for sulfatase activity
MNERFLTHYPTIAPFMVGEEAQLPGQLPGTFKVPGNSYATADSGKANVWNIQFFGTFGSKGLHCLSIRVVRGGSWNNNDNNCTVSNRNRNNIDNRNNNIGFRLARY